MPIEFLPDEQTFFLQAGDSLCVMRMAASRAAGHLYWGSSLEAAGSGLHLDLGIGRSVRSPQKSSANTASIPSAGISCRRNGATSRSPALKSPPAQDGLRVLDLRYRVTGPAASRRCRIACHLADASAAQTLVLELEDARLGSWW